MKEKIKLVASMTTAAVSTALNRFPGFFIFYH